jgi:hypothetical protein
MCEETWTISRTAFHSSEMACGILQIGNAAARSRYLECRECEYLRPKVTIQPAGSLDPVTKRNAFPLAGLKKPKVTFHTAFTTRAKARWRWLSVDGGYAVCKISGTNASSCTILGVI